LIFFTILDFRRNTARTQSSDNHRVRHMLKARKGIANEVNILNPKGNP
jgi:hypothetical protein